MSQRDGFATGFIAGSVFGSLVGGVLGAMLASRINHQETDETETPIVDETPPQVKPEKAKKRQIEAGASEQRIEMARRSLEEKIAQLNQTIDEARQQLAKVNGNSTLGTSDTASATLRDRSLSKDA